MFAMPAPVQEIWVLFAPVFSRPVWNHAQLLILGAILARGKRTLTAALCAMGITRERHFTNYHRVLNRAVWHTWFASKILLGLLVALFPKEAPLLVLLDETIEQRKGDKITTKGAFRDAVRSSRNKVVHCYGLRWVAMMLLVQLPWSKRPWALPFYTVQAPSLKTCQKIGKRLRSVIDLVCSALRVIRRWHPNRAMVVIGDGAHAALELIQSCRSLANPVTLVVRFRWNAKLYDPHPEPIPGKRGRKPGRENANHPSNNASPIQQRLGTSCRCAGTMERSRKSSLSPGPGSGIPWKTTGFHPPGCGKRPSRRLRGHPHPLHRLGSIGRANSELLIRVKSG